MKYGYQRTMTAREMRRIGQRERNKEERRKQAQAFWAMSPEERAQQVELSRRLEAMQKNGITVDDVRRAEREGQQDGYKHGIDDALHTCYAAIALTACEDFGFDKEKCIEFLRGVDDRIVGSLSAEEAVQEALDSVGISITFSSPFPEERVAEVDEA